MQQPGGGRRLFLSVLAGSLLLQLAWILAVPAFRGSDEFDHVIKADATAHGQWTGSRPPARGRGELMTIRDDVAEALGPMCASYKYTGPDNCYAVRDNGDGTIEIASAASAYNPAYYLVAGVVALPFPGAAADFAMRGVTAVLSALLVAWAAVVTRSWARGAWPGLALVVSFTPVVAYSTTVAAPNGVGMAGGALLWAALGGLASDRDTLPLAAAAVAASAVAVTHTTGLLWVPISLALVLALRPAWWWVTRFARRRRGAVAWGLVVLGSVAYAVAWIRSAGTNALAPPSEDLPPMRMGDLANQVLAWVLQTVAAFPLRNETAPLAVYPMWVLTFLALLVLGLVSSRVRVRAALLVVLALWFAIPIALTVISYASEPYAWQGRYAMPLAVGLPMMAGYALSEAGRRPSRLMILTVVCLTGVSHVVSIAAVTAREAGLRLSPTFADLVPGPPLVAALLVGAVAAVGFVIAVRGWGPSDADIPEADEKSVAVA